MKIFRIVKYQLYLLQLENYELGRYFKLLRTKGLWPRGQQRKELVWTNKAKLVLCVAAVLHLFFSLAYGFFAFDGSFGKIAGAALLFAVFYFDYFLLFTLAVLLLWPADFLAKKFVIYRAKSRIKEMVKLKVIGIAGSYGKTTMKEVLHEVLGSKFKVQAPPESVNTPLGIAQWVLKRLNSDTEILVVEMGEHYRGDVRELARFLRPEVSVLTGINEAHLERMGSLENIVSTIFEAAEYASPDSLLVLNSDDKNIAENYKKYTTGKKTVFYSAGNNELSEYRAVSKTFDESAVAQAFELEKGGQKYASFKTSFLGEYIVGTIMAAVLVAEHFGLSEDDIRRGVIKLAPVEHRLQPILSGGNVLVIDDSYNGNPDGVREAINVLSKFKTRRKVYISPGLVETGSRTREVHREIGRQLAGTADVVILIKNSVTFFIEEGIKEVQAGKKPELVWFDSAPEAHAALSGVIKPGDVVLFQNDWGDQYS